MLFRSHNYFDGTYNVLFDRIAELKATEPPYSERYLELATLLEDNPALPRGNKLLRNICTGPHWLDLVDCESAWHKNVPWEGPIRKQGRWVDERDGVGMALLEVQDNLLAADPGFVDAAAGDYRLREDSPAWALGFQRIPVEEIGLQKDEYR